ncbi:hypothetical protein [Pseudodesulfovibrio sediminis]|uniref:Uncharacterized protein n=1 Tax=Pseudodesulfovibrio sediminis TaxID=2810563 RepID=A0ABN6EMM6_9BACT|nr:hypothetical protein [Pseudodesulfovibrio sediminis]BCS87338.1 hypothetical protein PSDVSF_05800 [Pseudodesulfovibrio sediminis]
MCGSSSGSKSGPATSSFGGYSFGKGLGSIASQRRAENRAAMSRGTNVTNSPGYKANTATGKQTMGGAVAAVAAPVAEKPSFVVNTNPQLSVPTAPITAFREMQEDDGVVNAATYSKLGIQAIEQGRLRADARDMTRAERDFSEYGEFKQPKGTQPFDRTKSVFEPDRWIGGKAWDALTGIERTAPMSEMIRMHRAGVGKTAAKELSQGDDKVVDGKIAQDPLGLAIDMAGGVFNMVTRSPLSALYSFGKAGSTLYDYNTMEKAGVFGTRKKDEERVTRSDTAIPRRAPGTSTEASTPTLGMLGNNSSRQGVSVTPVVADDDAPTPAVAPRKVTRSRYKSTLLTGGLGLQSEANTLFKKLYGA